MPLAGDVSDSESAQAVALVQRFFDATVATPDGFWTAFTTSFDEMTVWENVGVARTVGPVEAAAFAKAFPVKFHHMCIEDLVVSGEGGRVYAERLDHFCNEDGTIVLTVRALGVLRSIAAGLRTGATSSTRRASLRQWPGRAHSPRSGLIR